MEKVVVIENGRINNIGVFLQCILLVIMIILGICTIFIPELSVVTSCSLAGLLGVMGYNNHTLFKRKGWTMIYIAVAVLVFLVGVFHV